MKDLLKYSIIIKAVVCVMLVFAAGSELALADVGNSVSHDDSGSFGESFDSSGDGLDLWFIIYMFRENPMLALIIIAAYFAYRKFGPSQKRKTSRGTPRGSEPHQPQPRYETASIAKLKEKDPLFSDEVFLSKVNNMFIQLQQAWMDKQWASIRPFESDALFNMHNRQLSSYIEQHRTNVVDNIAILETRMVQYDNDGAHDKLDVYIRARMNDYVIDDQTKKVIKGDPKRDIYMTYVWTLIRKDTVLTKESTEQYEVTQCPNCGANVSINASGQCEYCESIISSGDYDWVLSKIKVVNQR